MPIVKDRETEGKAEVEHKTDALRTDAFRVTGSRPNITFVHNLESEHKGTPGVMERLMSTNSFTPKAYTPYVLPGDFRYCTSVFENFPVFSEYLSDLDKCLATPCKFSLSKSEGESFQERVGSLSYKELLRLYLECKVAMHELQQLIDNRGKKQNIQLKQATSFTRSFVIADGYTHRTKDDDLVIPMQYLSKRFIVWQDCAIILLRNLMEYKEYYRDFFYPRSVRVEEDNNQFADLEPYVSKVDLGPSCYVTDVKFPQLAFPSRSSRLIEYPLDTTQETISRTLTAALEWLYDMDIREQLVELKKTRDGEFFQLCDTCAREATDAISLLSQQESSCDDKLSIREQQYLLSKFNSLALHREVLRTIWRTIKSCASEPCRSVDKMSTQDISGHLQRVSQNISIAESFGRLRSRLGPLNAGLYSNNIVDCLRYSAELKRRSGINSDTEVGLSVESELDGKAPVSDLGIEAKTKEVRDMRILKRMLMEYKVSGSDSLLGSLIGVIAKREDAIKSGRPSHPIDLDYFSWIDKKMFDIALEDD